MNTSKLGDRQRGNLRGRLGLGLTPARIVLAAEHATAASRTGQVLLVTLTNLLSRQVDEVAAIDLQVPSKLPACPGLTPLTQGGLSLTNTLQEVMTAINPDLDLNRPVQSTVVIRALAKVMTGRLG